MKRLILSLLLSLLLASPAWAFPANGVLDNFTDSDGVSLPTHSANWTNFVAGAAGNGMQIKTNTATTSSAAGFGSAYWNATTFGPDSEAYVKFASVVGMTNAIVYVRAVNIGDGTTDAYGLRYTIAGTVLRLVRIDNDGAATALGSDITQAVDADDEMGITAIGDQLCAWFNNDGAGWTQVGSCVTDATYSAAGNIGLGTTSANNVTALDDFGGGNITSAAALQSGQGFLGGILK